MKMFLAVALVLMMTLPAMALELDASGEYRVRWFSEKGSKNVDRDRGYIDQRVRLFLDADNGDGVRGVLGLEMGDARWGDDASYADQGADGIYGEVKHAYIDIDKEIEARAGVFKVKTPNGILLSDDQAGVKLKYKMVELYYLRNYDGSLYTERNGESIDDEVHSYGVMVPFSLGGIKLKPYLFHTEVEKDADEIEIGFGDTLTTSDTFDGASYTWLGLNLKGKALGLKYDVNFIYGTGTEEDDINPDNDVSGYVIDATIVKKFENKHTLEVYALYASGEDSDSDGSERMPTISSYYTTGAHTFWDAKALSRSTRTTPTGYAQLGATYAFDVIEDVKLELDAAYIMNTNDSDYRAAEDEMKNWKTVSATTTYKVAKGTTLSWLLGATRAEAENSDTDTETAVFCSAMLKYKFK